MKTMMLGAMVGDIAGSIYEHHNIKHEPLTLVDNNCYFTDDTVLTMGVAEGIMNGLEQSPEDWLNNPETCDNIRQNIHNAVHKYARMFPNAGYGGRFRGWMYAEDPHPYNRLEL